jgi:hypothetical protein
MTIELAVWLIQEETVLQRCQGTGDMREIVQYGLGFIGTRGLTLEVEDDDDRVRSLRGLARKGLVVDSLTDGS